MLDFKYGRVSKVVVLSEEDDAGQLFGHVTVSNTHGKVPLMVEVSNPFSDCHHAVVQDG